MREFFWKQLEIAKKLVDDWDRSVLNVLEVWAKR
jgi:hypothetical protein